MFLKLIGNLLRRGAGQRDGSSVEPDANADSRREALSRGAALEQRGLYEAAVACYRECVAEHPADPQAHAALINALHESWRNEECMEACANAVNATGGHPAILSGLLMFSHYAANPDPRVVFELHRAYGKRMKGATPAVSGGSHSRDPEKRLRVGYVSRDLRLHSVTDFLEPVIVNHDRGRFEVHCYHTHDVVDEVSERLARAADAWHHVMERDPERLAARIAADRIDVLVDLAGHTKTNSLPAFAKRPAPVQITWLGYPDTTGLGAMDWRVTDRIADPAPQADALNTERLLRLEPPFLCYRPPPDSPPMRPRAPGPVVFGCFNALAKVNEPLIASWARMLAAVPRSTLVLKSQTLGCEEIAERVRGVFARHGIGPERLEFRTWAQTREMHLPAYSEIDIALDTFPYNGTTTTCEALWMGVPVVTLAGEMHMSRVGATLLAAVGLEALVARSADGYVKLATDLASDAPRRAALAAGMRERLEGSPLLDQVGFTRRLEAAYAEAWRTWCANPPA